MKESMMERRPKQERPIPEWQQIRMAKEQQRISGKFKTAKEREAERRMREIEEEELQEQLALRERRKALEKEAYARGVSIEEMAAIDANRRKQAYANQEVWGSKIAGWMNSFSTPSFPR
jgi:hypothetical protein